MARPGSRSGRVRANRGSWPGCRIMYVAVSPRKYNGRMSLFIHAAPVL
jgi:hypothetical protein